MATEFQSRTFRLKILKKEDFDIFEEDINVLKTFNTSELKEILKHIKKIILADTEKEEHKIYDEIINSKLIDNQRTINSFERTVTFFLKIFSNEESKEDNPEKIIKDIKETFDFDENELSSIKYLLELIKNEAEWYGQEKLKKDFEKGLFPYLKKIGTTVELRGVFNHEDKSDKVKINEDNPIIPTISVAITLDSGIPDRFCFQVSPEHLEWLIEKLKVALQESKILKERFNLE